MCDGFKYLFLRRYKLFYMRVATREREVGGDCLAESKPGLLTLRQSCKYVYVCRAAYLRKNMP